MTVGPAGRGAPGYPRGMARCQLTVPVALALRRAVAAGGALAATIAAHAIGTGELALAPVAPAAWLGMLAVAVMLGGRRRWRARGVAGSLALMAPLQAAAHVALSLAPWLAGMAPHHAHGVDLGPATLAAHTAAAVLLALALAHLERLLGAAIHVAAVVRRHLARRPRPARRPARVAVPAPVLRSRIAARPGACRGPPLISPA